MKTNGNVPAAMADGATVNLRARVRGNRHRAICLLYTSDAADE